MGALLLLSMLALGLVFGLLDDDDPEPVGGQDADPDLEPDPSDPPPPENTDDLTAPEPPTLDENVIRIAGADAPIDHSARTEGGAYRVNVSNYDLTTGSGDDTVIVVAETLGRAYLGDGDDAAWGGEGRDILRGEGGNDSLFGGDGNDSLIDLEGQNSLHGGEGDDFIRASNGSTIVGGDGADEFDLYLSTSDEDPLRLLDYDPEEDQLNEIRLFVSDGDIYDVTAVAREDGKGADLMFGDRVLAEIFGASVEDLTDIPVTIIVNGGTFTDDEGDHTIRTNFDLPETIFAEGGDDTIRGGPGDLLDAGDGNDLIFASGQFSEDVSNPSDMSTVQGGPGDDILLSTNGNVLTGGDGADIFGLSLSQYNSGGTGSGFDLTESVITDFDPTEDVIFIESGFIYQAGGTVAEPEETLSIQVWPDGEGADIFAGDERIARVSGGQTLRVEDLMIAENGLEAEIRGLL